jgi:type VI secretion system protein ImpJ
MPSRAVHWHEGMFLRPHHFQAADRYLTQQAQFATSLDLHHCWGLRSIDIDPDALANGRLVVRSLRARLPDGTLVSVPEDGTLPAVEIKPVLEKSPDVTAYLAVPVARLGRANAAAPGARYRVETQELEDENTGVNPQPVAVRVLDLQLLLSTQDRGGYEALPVVRVERSSRADAAPQLATSYIPPLLACDAWPVLRDGILQQVHDRVGKKLDLLATQITTRGLGFDSTGQGDSQLLAQLRVLNEASAVLGVSAFTPGIHPLPVFAELCRFVGQLAVFGPARRPPALPRYDHDDLGGCFWRLKQYIDDLLGAVVEPEYRERPFVGAGLRMQVALEPSWLEPAWAMFIGVKSPLGPDELIRLLTQPGQLDMKVGSGDRVDGIFRMGQAGLTFTPSPRPPRALPSAPGLVYLQVSREAGQAEWLNVQRSLTLAIRLNESLVAGDIQGQRVLTIRRGGVSSTLEFTLYVVPQRGE